MRVCRLMSSNAYCVSHQAYSSFILVSSCFLHNKGISFHLPKKNETAHEKVLVVVATQSPQSRRELVFLPPVTKEGLILFSSLPHL